MSRSARTGNLLGALAFALSRRMSEAMTAAGLAAGSDQASLILLSQYPGTTVGTLSQLLELSPSSTVRVVDRLTAKGLMRRAAHDNDARHVVLELSAKGRRLAAAVLQARALSLASCVEALPASDQAALSGLLERLLGALTDSRLTADRICRYCDEAACVPGECPVETKALSLG
jgi:MarR family transcriptional regulator, negative regulator of the multidrug operon emrRAB